MKRKNGNDWENGENTNYNNINVKFWILGQVFDDNF